MLKLYGYNELTEPTGRKVCCDTFQCAHCNATVFIDPKEPSPWCSCCDKQWCGRRKCRECTPFMRKIEAEEAADRARRLLWQSADNT